MRSMIFAVALIGFSAQAQLNSAAEDELLKAYQREYAFLAAQKESLQKQIKRVRKTQDQKLVEAEQAVRQLERETVRTQTENDRLFNDVQVFERRRKDEQGLDATIKSLWKRMRKGVIEHRMALEFRGDATPEQVPPEDVGFATLAALGHEALQVLDQSKDSGSFEKSYLNAQDELVDGKVLRVGRVAAFSMNGGVATLLGPGGSGALKEIDDIPKANFEASLIPIYTFESVREKLKLKRPAGWMDRLADLSPIMFLGTLFLMVGWLFAKLARI